MSEKQCTKCGEMKPFSEYHKAKRCSYGLHPRCKECMREITRQWNAANAERKRELERKRREANPTYYTEWRKNNLAKDSARASQRRASTIQRTPKWLTKEDIAEIEAVYEQARVATESTGVQHHVDHIIPLRGKLVSGLHVPWNLQVLTASENASKGNRLT